VGRLDIINIVVVVISCKCGRILLIELISRLTFMIKHEEEAITFSKRMEQLRK
jgi:hypothetical protein